MRTVAGALVGLVTAFLTVYLLELVGHNVFPPADPPDFSNPESLRKFMDNVPASALVFVLAAWSLAIPIGGAVAAMIARNKQALLVMIIAGLVILGAIANMVMLPHPMWFMIAATVLLPVVTGLTALLAARAGKQG